MDSSTNIEEKISFKDFIEEGDKSSEIGANNIITGLLYNLLRKNTTYNKEGFLINDIYVDVKLDTSGFEENLIIKALEEFISLNRYSDTKNLIYYGSRISLNYYNHSEEYIKFTMPKRLFLELRSNILALNKESKRDYSLSTSIQENNQLKIF